LHNHPTLVAKSKEKGNFPEQLLRLQINAQSSVKKKQKEAGDKMTG